jgi:hypothetical protein
MALTMHVVDSVGKTTSVSPALPTGVTGCYGGVPGLHAQLYSHVPAGPPPETFSPKQKAGVPSPTSDRHYVTFSTDVLQIPRISPQHGADPR